jgi:hypothetical protein
MKMRWRSLFQSTSFGKQCTSCNAPPISWRCAADRLPQSSGGKWKRRFWPQSSLYMAGKGHKSHRARSGLYGGSNGVSLISVSPSIATFQSRNSDAPLRLLRHPKNVSFKTTVTRFSRSGWSVVRNASLAKGGTSKKRPSRHLHTVPTRSNKVSPRILQTVLVIGMQAEIRSL